MATDTAPPPTYSPPTPDVRRVSVVRRLLARPGLGAGIALVAVWAFFAIVAWDNNFVSWRATAAILNQAAPLGIVAIAVALLMIAGEFDLSVGSVIGFTGMVMMLLLTPPSAGGLGWPILLAIGGTFLVALLIGFLNGILVITTKLPSFIITLGSLFIFRGLAVAVPRTLTNRTQLGGLDQAAGFGPVQAVLGTKIEIGNARFDIAILWMVALGVLASWILLRTRVGNWIFGAGGDPDAARNVGVPVSHLKVGLFVATAFASFFAALLQAVQFNGADSLRGTLRELEAVAVVVVGGTLLTGGYGSVIGALLGAVLFATVQQGIVITGVDGDWFKVFVGGILVLAVIFNNIVRQQAVKR